MNKRATMSCMRAVCISFLLFVGVSVPAFAVDPPQGWMDSRTISSIGIEDNFAAIWVSDPYSSNPAGCASTPITGAILIKTYPDGSTNPNFKIIYSTLLAASLAGKSVKFWTKGCYSAWNVCIST